MATLKLQIISHIWPTEDWTTKDEEEGDNTNKLPPEHVTKLQNRYDIMNKEDDVSEQTSVKEETKPEDG